MKAVRKSKFDKFVNEVKEAMGKELVGTVDLVAQGGQFAFATSEPDRGESVRGRWMDALEEKMERHGLRRVVCMPFPVEGRLVYTLAGLAYAK